ncbi:hypothetical protein KY320_02935 [Candidatus Woesearchaeota archaeon]|nr:hypothetical protein [Candidatus Woesearchaeota archaeon]
MIRAIRLETNETISKLRLNQFYAGEIVSPASVKLNRLMSAKLQTHSALKPGTKVAVRILKIKLPDTVEAEIVDEPYIIEDSWRFLVESAVLTALKPRMRKAASMIKDAVREGNQIIVKHHADCDGYVAAIALERAILELVMPKHRNYWSFFKRNPCRSPVYEYIDAVKDVTGSYEAIIAGKPPLIIIVDNGSSEQDLFGIMKARLYGARIIVVDHHKPSMVNGKAVVAEHVDVFINPYVAGGDSNLTAGMLGVELSRFVHKGHGIEHLGAVSGVADRSQGAEFEKYIQLAKSASYDEKLLKSIAVCIDFEAFQLGYSTSKLIDDLLFNTQDRENKLKIIEEHIRERETMVISSVKSTDITELDKRVIVRFDTSVLKRATYPSQGKATGMVFTHFKGCYQKPVVVLGIGESSITFRTSLEDFDLNQLIAELCKELPDAGVEGGGHEVAGTLHFNRASKQAVLEYIGNYLRR